MKIEYPIFVFASNRVKTKPKTKVKIVMASNGKFIDDNGKQYKYIDLSNYGT